MLIGLDTTSDRLSLAVRDAGGRTAVREVIGRRQHAAALGPSLDAALRELGARLEDAVGIALADGPGSFTGLRVGAAFAKAVARARGIPLWTSSTLLVRACGGGGAPGRRTVAGVGAALRNELYVAVYRFDGELGVETLVEPAVVGLEAGLPTGITPDLIVGDILPATLATCSWARHGRIVGPPDGLPRAERLLDLVAAGRAERVDDPAGWQPNYGRPAEAQAQWERVHGRRLVDPSCGS